MGHKKGVDPNSMMNVLNALEEENKDIMLTCLHDKFEDDIALHRKE